MAVATTRKSQEEHEKSVFGNQIFLCFQTFFNKGNI
jgi:hypothetical protein